MTYSKPEIVVLGAAADIIQHLTNKTTSTAECQGCDPAYDLDE